MRGKKPDIMDLSPSTLRDSLQRRSVPEQRLERLRPEGRHSACSMELMK